MTSFTFSNGKIASIAADLIAVPVYADTVPGPGAREMCVALEHSLEDLIAQAPLVQDPISKSFATFSGQLGAAIAIPTLGTIAAKQVLFVGVGPKTAADATVARKLGAVVARRAGNADVVATSVHAACRGTEEELVERVVEGFRLASYAFDRYKGTKNLHPNWVEEVVLTAKGSSKTLKAAVTRAEVHADATILARDLINTPASDKSPTSLAAEASRVAKEYGLGITIFDETQLEAQGFGGLIGVGRGSSKPPRLVELRYEPRGAKRTIAIVGKGITFDSGGLNLKPKAGMEWMKTDMSGAASVIALMQAVGALKPKGVAIRGYVASAENMPDGNALHPGDVITHYGGITSEIGNTDAEGRLVMADAIAYANERGADVILDIATLTGACMIALGHHVFGVLGTSPADVKAILRGAEHAGEPAWELPMHRGYRPYVTGRIADLYNEANADIGGGAITAALFLAEFAGDTPYVHLDIAGPSRSAEDRFEVTRGGTGVGVRTLIEYVVGQGT